MNIVHSFASSACSDKTFLMHMAYFVLSCLYAKESGFNIKLHADNRTAEFLSVCPYDNIIADLEGIDWPAPRLYAWSKFVSMKDEPLGTIHIDGDVFLKDPVLLEKMKFDEYDCIVQNIELPASPWGFGWKEASKSFENCEYPEWANRKCNAMYNCGIIGFNNQTLKDKYFETYWDMVDQYRKYGTELCNVPDLIIEQQFLKDLTKDYKVKELLDFDDLTGSADNIGYQHVIGVKGKELSKVLSLIKKHNLNIYNKIINCYGQIYNNR